MVKAFTLYDTKNRRPSSEGVNVNPDDVKSVRQRFYRDKNLKPVEGTVIEMREDFDGPSQYDVAEDVASVRRSLDIIEARPPGSEPPKELTDGLNIPRA